MVSVARLASLFSLLVLTVFPSAAPLFTEMTGAGLTGLVVSKLTLGDYDNDGDLDLAVEGWNPGLGARFTRIYNNSAGVFSHETNAVFQGINEGPIVFGDGDNDGRLDLVSGGWTGAGTATRLYRNEGGGAYHSIPNVLRGMKGSDVAWADIDNDGDLDLIAVGESYDDLPHADYSQIYRNDGNGRFVLIQDLPGVYQGQVAVGDYDGDGDLDLAITGRTVGSAIFRNDAGVFTDINAGLPALWYSAFAWADIDNDGDLDLALSGGNGSVATHCDIYRNDAGSFVALNAGLPAIHAGDLRWGDFDNDGDPDLVITGLDSASMPLVRVYVNTASVFVDAAVGLVAMANVNTSAWGDYDNDGDLDLIVAGHDLIGQSIKLYRNDTGPVNSAPSVPGSPSATVTGTDVTFSWTASSDTQSPAAGLTYNLRVGTTPGGQQIMAAMSNLSSGQRRIAAPGNVQHNLSWKLRNLPIGTYYYGVQAVDGGYMSSSWTAEGTIVVPAPPAARIMVMMPAPGTTVAPPASIAFTLTAPPDPAGVNASTVVVVGAGADLAFGTGDDIAITPTGLSVAGSQILIDLAGLTLADGLYRVTLRGNAPVIPNLVNWWKLDDGPLGASAADSAGAATGTLGGGGGTAPTWENGRLGGALRFSSANTRVTLGAADLPVPWTAALWVNRSDSAAPDARLMDSAASSLRLEQFNFLPFMGVTDYAGPSATFTYMTTPGLWVHVTLVGQAAGTSLYVNGMFWEQIAGVIPCPRGSLGSLGVNSMRGLLDDVRLFDRALTASEITAVAGLGGVVRSATGSALDGEFSGIFPSGQGVAGGDFVATFTVTTPSGGGGGGCGLFGPELLAPWLLLVVSLRFRRERPHRPRAS